MASVFVVLLENGYKYLNFRGQTRKHLLCKSELLKSCTGKSFTRRWSCREICLHDQSPCSFRAMTRGREIFLLSWVSVKITGLGHRAGQAWDKQEGAAAVVMVQPQAAGGGGNRCGILCCGCSSIPNEGSHLQTRILKTSGDFLVYMRCK